MPSILTCIIFNQTNTAALDHCIPYHDSAGAGEVRFKYYLAILHATLHLQVRGSRSVRPPHMKNIAQRISLLHVCYVRRTREQGGRRATIDRVELYRLFTFGIVLLLDRKLKARREHCSLQSSTSTKHKQPNGWVGDRKARSGGDSSNTKDITKKIRLGMSGKRKDVIPYCTRTDQH